MRKTQQTDAPQRLETCHDLGACLLAPDCACLAACQQPPRQVKPRSRARQFTVDLSVAMALIVAMILLVDLVVWLHSAGWL